MSGFNGSEDGFLPTFFAMSILFGACGLGCCCASLCLRRRSTTGETVALTNDEVELGGASPKVDGHLGAQIQHTAEGAAKTLRPAVGAKEASDGVRQPTALEAANKMQSSPVIKGVALSLLVLQISGFYLLVQHTRSIPGDHYDSDVVVLLIELTKLGMCLVMMAKESVHAVGLMRSFGEGFGMSELLKKEQRAITLRLCIPAASYALQNNLTFVAALNLSAVLVQVIVQTKTLSAALFSMVIIGRRFSGIDWLSFFMLVAGVATVVVANSQDDSSASSGEASGNVLLGLVAGLGAAASSGFAGVFVEFMFTKRGSSLWVRNVQLCFYSIPLQLGLLFYHRVVASDAAEAKGLFAGFHSSTVAVVLVQAVGGIINSIVIKYAGNMPRTFAAAVSIVLTSILAVLFFGQHVGGLFGLGVFVVVAATILYEVKSVCNIVSCLRNRYKPTGGGRTRVWWSPRARVQGAG